jgi:hypothetical protein
MKIRTPDRTQQAEISRRAYEAVLLEQYNRQKKDAEQWAAAEKRRDQRDDQRARRTKTVGT